MMLTNIVLSLLVVLQMSPASANFFSRWANCAFKWSSWNPVNYWKCMGWMRRLQSDLPGADQESFFEEQQGALNEILETGEQLNFSPKLWQETLEFLEEESVSIREDVERLVFEGISEDPTFGLLEEVILTSAIWQKLEEHVDLNKDGALSIDEWKAVDFTSIPVPTTPGAFKNVMKQGKKLIKDTFFDFLEAGMNFMDTLEESSSEEGEVADEGMGSMGSNSEGMIPPAPVGSS